MTRIMVVGEGMMELSRAGAGWRLGHGGDTLNTALHLVRFGCNVAYATALGADPFSEELRATWRSEGLDTSLVLTDPDRLPGVYAIRTDEHGERSFFYWRSNSAARRLFALPEGERVVDAASNADLLVFSLISLAILPPVGREALFDLCRRVRARGGKVAFDGNYRPALWGDRAEARASRDAAIAFADIALPTLEDEEALSGVRDADGVNDEWRALGAREVVVKLGSRGCFIDGAVIPPPARLKPTDTSGAGDSFNAGYLCARLRGACAEDAARVGHRIAGWVIMHPGAVPERTSDAPYST